MKWSITKALFKFDYCILNKSIFCCRQVVKYRTKIDPRVVAKYDIQALIGRGSFSKVVRVERKGTQQPYAIKMINVCIVHLMYVFICFLFIQMSSYTICQNFVCLGHHDG